MHRTLWIAGILAGCGTGVNDEASARYAYMGLDTAVDRAMNLGLDGYNTASSANIDDQQGSGSVGGTMVVGGQVDQGSSDNKGLRLDVALVAYRDALVDDNGDDILTVYDTDAPISLDISLKNIPNGTFDATFAGVVLMSDGLEGPLDLDLAISGTIEPGDGDDVRRVAGSTVITGTASSDYGVYDVNLTR